MDTIAFTAFILSYILAPTHPLTWALLVLTLIALAYKTARLIRPRKARP